MLISGATLGVIAGSFLDVYFDGDTWDFAQLEQDALSHQK